MQETAEWDGLQMVSMLAQLEYAFQRELLTPSPSGAEG
jgi:hypothetical protein